jgi:acyl transferase domain-containing protein
MTPSTSADRAPSAPGIPIAIVGLAGLFPKAGDVRRFWQNILNRVDAIQEVPPERWREADYFDEDRFAPDKSYSKWGGFLDPIRFDPMKWKIPPASLMSIDPVQLLSLEVADRAFIDAGYHERPFPKERTGVIFACAGMNDVGSDYAFRTMISDYLPKMDGIPPEVRQSIIEQTHQLTPEWTEDSFPGILTNVIAGRIANRFDLGGPNFTVDAACAASLAALYSAIAQLRLGTVDMMLVGAADAANNAFSYMCFAKTHALSPRGRSRPFDDSADGISLGEGVAAVLIKRLDDALRDGDKIYAVIRGMGSSSDGRNRSMTAPHPGGQILALRRAYEDAGVPCASISLVEAHGTGTAVGDGTEITSLNRLFSQECTDKQFAAVGSVKSMIGHTKTCAGLASLVKTALALHHRILPPTLHVEKPNRNVDFQDSAFFINTETRPWFAELGDHPRRAGISAFGFGGTNFHVVMEESPATSDESDDFSPRPVEIVTWTRPTKIEIVSALRHLREQIGKLPVNDFASLAFSIRHDEISQPGGCRLAIVAGSVDDFMSKLAKTEQLLADSNTVNDPTGIFYSEKPPADASKVAFLYPGQGSQSVNMLRDLVVMNRWCHSTFADANRRFAEFLPKALTRYIYPPPAFSPEDLDASRRQLSDTCVAQPALGLVEVFCTDLLKRYGISPGATAGHSYGEYVALYAAGCLSRDDLFHVSAHRGRISYEVGQSTTPGAMAAVNAGPAQIRELISELGLEVSLANLNAPDQTIVAGPEGAVDRAVEMFSQKGLRSKRLAVTGAFHTPLMSTAAEQLGEILGAVKFHKAQCPVYSNTTASLYPEKPAEIRRLLERHLTEPVQFEQQIRRMRSDGAEIFLEVGPGRVLTSLVQRIFPQDGPLCLALDAGGRDGATQFAHVLGQLFALGLPVDLSEWYAHRGLKSVGVSEFLKSIAESSQPKPTEWILTTHSATPITPLPKRVSNGEGLRAKFGKQSTGPRGSGESATNKPPSTAPNRSAEAPKHDVPSLRPAAEAVQPPAEVVRPVAGAPPPLAAMSGVSRELPIAPLSPLFSSAAASRRPASVPITQMRCPTPMNNTQPSEPIPNWNAASAQMLAQSQALMLQLLDLQRWQQQVALRFLEAQQQWMQQLAGGCAAPVASLEMPNFSLSQPVAEAVKAEAIPAAPAVTSAPVVAAPPPPVVAAAAPPVVRVAPAAVKAAVAVNRVATTARVQAPAERRVAVTPERPRNGATPTNGAHEDAPSPSKNGAGIEHAATKGVEIAKPSAPAAPSTNGERIPTVDEFRAALLQAVSERTGYPVDMLDESLPLEAGLGIDSIKTVEIFSNLKEYHRFFQRDGEDEEEALKEFMQLKTLGDIISAYELQYQAHHSGESGGESKPASSGAVERYALEAVEAGPLNGEKKNSPVTT